jgi:glycerol-3-phosphate O-acyltransferase
MVNKVHQKLSKPNQSPQFAGGLLSFQVLGGIKTAEKALFMRKNSKNMVIYSFFIEF